MKLALVFNPFSYKLHEENLRIVQRYFGLFPPLSLAWVAAIAERAGHQVALVDARTLRLSKSEVHEGLVRFKPDIIGFMMTTYMFRETLEWIRYLKERLGVPVVVGGYNLRVYPKESVTPEEIDFGVVDSALHTLPQLLAELEGEKNFENVAGLVYKRDGEILCTPPTSPPESFEDYPNPARHLLPNELYAEFPTERKNFSVLVSSKGCPYGCTFCEAGSTPYNARKPITVVNEMEECYRDFGIREIDIFDYEFPVDRKRATAICEKLVRRRLDIQWACRSRIDSVNEPLIRLMHEAGCSRIYYGIESGVQEFLDKMNKGITLDRVRETVRFTRKAGVRPLGFFLIGAPGETKETVKRTVKFSRELALDYTQFSKLTAKPLTTMWRDLVKDTGRDYWREYILGETEEAVLPRPWTDLTNEEIDQLTRKAYIDFHSRPRFLLRALLKVKSLDELRRKISAFLAMVFSQEDVSAKDDSFIAYHDQAGKLWWYKKIAKWSQPF